MRVVQRISIVFASCLCACCGVPQDVVQKATQQIVLTSDAAKAGIAKCKSGDAAMCDQASTAVDDIKTNASALAEKAK